MMTSEPDAKVSFRITTFMKRPRGQRGITRLDSERIDLGQAIGLLLGVLPEGSYEMTYEGDDGRGGARKTFIVIDWDKVPVAISEGLS